MLANARGERFANPLTIGRRAGADVDGDVEQRAGGPRDQIVLGVWGTREMQAADGADLCAAGFVVLNEVVIADILREQIGTECFGEIAAFISDVVEDQERDVGNVVSFDLHNSPSHKSMPIGTFLMNRFGL